MHRVTADANAFVSGLVYRRGKPFELIRMALEGEISLVISQPIIDETLDVLGRKFGIPAGELPGYEAVLRQDDSDFQARSRRNNNKALSPARMRWQLRPTALGKRDYTCG